MFFIFFADGSNQKINKIEVRKLFGYHSYDIEFAKDLSMLYGANGLGKTTIFRLIEAIFIRPKKDDDFFNIYDILFSVPFDYISIDFSSGIKFIVKYENENKITIRYPFLNDKSINIIRPRPDMLKGISNKELVEHYELVNNLLFLDKDQNKLDRKIVFVKVNRIENLDVVTKRLTNYITKKEEALSMDPSLIKNILRSKLITDPAWYRKFQLLYGKLIGEFNKKANYIFQKNGIDFVFPNKFFYGNDFLCVLKNRNMSINDINSYQICEPEDVMSLSKELLSLFSLYLNGTKRERINIRHEMLSLIIDSRISELNEIKRKLVDFYEKFDFLKELYEGLYYFSDPSKKKLVLDNLSIIAKAKNSLQDDSFRNRIPMNKMSSGEQNILAILYYLVYETDDGSIVFIDEPEVSLHMAWQKEMANIIKTIMDRKKNLQIIIATHSPFVTSGHEEYFVTPTLIRENQNDNYFKGE